jgi:predicted AAA+ superfamily ATPase
LVNWFDTQGTKVSIQTATNYVNYAQSAFLFFLIYPYSRKIKERNTKPKLYVSDSGILGLLDSDVGKKLENAVFVELTRRGENVYYYKTASEDVDFLLTKENHVSELIQVCYSINEPLTYARETKSLLNAGQKLKCNNLTIVTFNEEKAIKLNENLVTVVPAWKWLRL